MVRHLDYGSSSISLQSRLVPHEFIHSTSQIGRSVTWMEGSFDKQATQILASISVKNAIYIFKLDMFVLVFVTTECKWLVIVNSFEYPILNGSNK